MGNADTHRAIATSGWPKVIFYFLQFTWGATVNLAGLLLFLFCRGRFHSQMFHNAIVTYLPRNRGGLSLGIFIFLSVRDRQELDRICAHEHGHTIQCLFLGPLYWFIVAIPSVIWYHFFAGYRKKRGISYDALFCEHWATAWGRKWSGSGPKLAPR